MAATNNDRAAKAILAQMSKKNIKPAHMIRLGELLLEFRKKKVLESGDPVPVPPPVEPVKAPSSLD